MNNKLLVLVKIQALSKGKELQINYVIIKKNKMYNVIENAYIVLFSANPITSLHKTVCASEPCTCKTNLRNPIFCKKMN